MEKLLNDELINQIKEMLSTMKEKVNISLFYEEGVETSQFTKQLLNEIKETNNLINLIEYDFKTNKELVDKYNVKNTPAFLIHKDNEEPKGTFYGVPAGHEINTLLTTIIDVSEANQLYDNKTLESIKKIDKPTNIKVFVTTQCPHCPGAAINSLRLAQLNKNVTAEVYEVHTNMEVGQKYKVSGVPKIVINEVNDLVGNQPISEFLKAINK